MSLKYSIGDDILNSREYSNYNKLSETDIKNLIFYNAKKIRPLDGDTNNEKPLEENIEYVKDMLYFKRSQRYLVKIYKILDRFKNLININDKVDVKPDSIKEQIADDFKTNENNLLKVYYIPVKISISLASLYEEMCNVFKPGSSIIIICTLQFKHLLTNIIEQIGSGYNIVIPRNAPLDDGVVLGCTSPVVPGHDYVISIADGTFHCEGFVYQNPEYADYFYSFHPYSGKLVKNEFNIDDNRKDRFLTRQISYKRYFEILDRNVNPYVYIVLGTLGRQGSVALFKRLCSLCDDASINYVSILQDMIDPEWVSRISTKNCVAVFQIACPRLSIDWGNEFDIPLLASHDANQLLCDIVSKVTSPEDLSYPMDYYRLDGGITSNYW